MIKDFDTILPAVLKVLESLEKSEFVFYPTGSRYFGNFNDFVSDWDFFVENSPEVRAKLIDLGFDYQVNPDYGDDDSITCVMRLHLSVGSDCFVDVQLIAETMIDTKIMAQRILKDRYKTDGLPGEKKQRSELWNVTMHAVQMLKT